MKQNRSGRRRILAGILISTGMLAGGIVTLAAHPAATVGSWHHSGTIFRVAPGPKLEK